MDQIKIGKFIAECRKKQNLTQEQLAGTLNITKNAVSKWERGLSLMDMSLLKPLSQILGVSITEILNGETLKEEEMMNKSEETIVQLSELYDLKSTRYGIIGMALVFILLVVISAFKGFPITGLTSLICAYNAIAFFSKYRFEKDQTNLFTSVMFMIASVSNFMAFIINN